MNDGPPVIFNLHGLRVRSQVPLPAPVVSSRRVDLDVTWSDPLENPEAALIGTLVARLQFPEGRGYSLVRTDAGWTLRFEAVADFRFDPSLRNVQVHLAPGGDSALVPLLLVGNIVAVVLSLGGHRILHASAVSFEGEGFGFLGGSGTGKSTVAALCCAAGARLIADDLLRLEPTSAGFRCVRGPSEIRLRQAAGSLAEWFQESAVRQTPDDRIAVKVEAAASDRVPLRVLAVPHPSREDTRVSIERLSPVEALYSLTRYARISGWRAPDFLGRQFSGFSDVAASVPVYKTVVPWGPPFPADLGLALLDKLRSQARAERAA